MLRILRLGFELGCCWALYQVARHLPPYRWDQLRELGLFCAVLFVVLLVYKLVHGIKIIW